MFEEIVFMFFFAVALIALSYVLLKWAPNPIDKFFRVVTVVGIVVQELSHALMCVLINTRIRSIKIVKRADADANFGLIHLEELLCCELPHKITELSNLKVLDLKNNGLKNLTPLQ